LLLAGPISVHLVSFFFLSLTSFRTYREYLFDAFTGRDGSFEVSLITQSSLFVPPILGLTNDFIHGLGNI